MADIRVYRRLILTAAVAVVVAMAMACGPAPTPTPTPLPPPDPQVLLDRAAQQLATEQYLSFVFEHPVGNTPLGSGVALLKAEGVAHIPDRFQVEIDMDAQGTPLRTGIISTGEAAFMTNPITEEWAQMSSPEQLPFQFDYITQLVGGLIGGATDLEFVGEDSLDGNAAYLLRGATATVGLAEVIPGTLPDGQLALELWIEQAGGKLLQLRATGALTVGDGSDTVRLLRLESLAEPPDISAP